MQVFKCCLESKIRLGDPSVLIIDFSPKISGYNSLKTNLRVLGYDPSVVQKVAKEAYRRLFLEARAQCMPKAKSYMRISVS